MFTYSGAKLDPQSDVAFRFSQDHTVFWKLHVVIPKMANFATYQKILFCILIWKIVLS